MNHRHTGTGRLHKPAGLNVTLLILVSLCACHTKQDTNSQALTDTVASTPPVKVLTFASGKGWGYEVKMGSRRFIYQPIIPAIGHHQPFNSEENARKTGELVAYKIKHNLMPPALSRYELDSLGVLEQENEGDSR